MIRKLIGRAFHNSVRRDLKTAEAALTSAAGGIYAEFSTNRKELKGSRNVKVNIGCGGLVLNEWINLDVHPLPGAFYTNVINGLPLTDGAASHIHCEHFLEHLDYSAAETFLIDCHRCLQAAGTLRIIVPDAEKYLSAYCTQDGAFFGELRHLGNAAAPLETRMQVVNQMFRMGGDHKFAWDFETLSHACQKAGFSSISRSRKGDVPEEFAIDGTDWWREFESLYANIRK